MNEEKWIHSIKEKLSNHRIVTTSSLWDKIEGQLPTSAIRIKRRRIYIAAAIATIAIIFSLAIFAPFKTTIYEQEVIVDRAIPQCPNPTTASHSTESTYIDNTKQEQIDNNQSTRNIARGLNGIALQDKHHTPDNEETIIHPITTSTSEANDNTCSTKQKKCEEHPFIDTSKPLKDYCIDSDSIYTDNHEEIIKQIRTHSNSSLLLAFEANTSYQQESITTFSFRCGEADIIFNHKMPLNVKVLLEKRLGKWSIGTGVSYTYMTADYEMSYNLRNGQQDLHYIGIPLYVGYELARIKRFSFYTSLGGQVDFNTQAIHSENSNSHAYPCIENIEFRDKKPQFSAQLHVGAAFEIVPHLDIYIEPMLGYYFDSGSKIHSAWHDQPWNVSLSFGLRTAF